MDHKTFFDSVRTSLFKGKLTDNQVGGMEAFFAEWERQQLTDARWLAYMMATAFHETAGTMQPIEEFGKGKGKPYGQKLKMGGGPGRRIPYTTPDKIYYGRGHTQNTWYENYDALTRAAQKAGHDWDFLNNPELLLQMEPSIWATFYAMQRGLYTGATLLRFFNDTSEDWVNARKIINGLDRADTIAGYGKTFFAALKQAGITAMGRIDAPVQ
jgi:hypothetical protein